MRSKVLQHPPCEVNCRQDSLCFPRGRGDYQLQGNYVRLAYQLPGKAAEWHTSHNFLDPNNRQLVPGASTQEVQPSEQSEVQQALSRRGWTGSKRTAIVSGLTIYLLICPVSIFIISPDPRIQRRTNSVLLLIMLNIAM